MGDEEVEYKAEYLDTAEDAEPEVGAHFATRCKARGGSLSVPRQPPDV